MEKYREAHRQDHTPSARHKSHHWLISSAWRYALSTFDLLEKERRRSLKPSMGAVDDAIPTSVGIQTPESNETLLVTEPTQTNPSAVTMDSAL